MTKRLLSNIPLKLLSVMVGILVWLLVVNADDPMKSVIISGVEVTIKNEAYIESAGLMCLVEEDADIISVAVTGKRSVVDNIKPSDITAVADLTQIADMSTTPVMVPITVSCPGISPVNIKAIPINMSIVLDDMMTQEFIVAMTTEEDKPGRGYEVGTLQAVPERVKITGPQSLIQKIDQVVAQVDVGNLTEDRTIPADLTIYDKNQEPLTSRQMAYLKYDITTPRVNVDVDLWRIKNDIGFTADYVGYPAGGYKVEKITLTPNRISVAGTDEALRQLTYDGNKIHIPEEYIDVSDRKEDFEVKIDLEELLPEGVKLPMGTNSTAIANVSILPQDSEEYSISTTRIQALNVPEGLQVVYEVDSVQVRVREGSRSLDNLSVTDIEASIDFSGKTEGTMEMPVKIILPEGYEVMKDVTTSVKLVSQETLTEGEE